MVEKKVPKPGPAELSETELKKITELLKAIGLALNNISLYTAKHRIAYMSLEQAFHFTDNYLSLNKELNLSFLDDQLLVENTPLVTPNPLINNFKSQIKKWSVDSVTFQAGLTQEELQTFLELLIQRPDKKENVDLSVMLTGKKINHVVLNKAVFIKATEAEAEAAKAGALKGKKGVRLGPKQIVVDEEKLSHFLIGLVKVSAKVKDSVMTKLEKEPEALAKDIMEAVRVKYDQAAAQDPDLLAEEITGCMDRVGEILEKDAYAGKGKTREQLANLFKTLEEALMKQIEFDETLVKKKEKVTNQAVLRLCKIKVGIITAEFDKRKKSMDSIVDLTRTLLTDEEENKRILPLLKARLTLEGMTEETFREMLERAGLKPKEKEDRKREIQESLTDLVQRLIAELPAPEEKKEAVQKQLLQGMSQVVNREVGLEMQELKTTNELLHQRVDKMDSVLKSIADAVVVVSPNGEVVFVNPAAERLLGIAKEKILGRHVMSEIGEGQMISLSKDQMGEKGAYEPTEIEVRGLRDTVKTIRQSVGVIHNKDGQTVGTVSVLTDVTKQKEIDQLKTDFVSNVSHELRTPLVSIQKSIQMILEKETGEINETQERFLQISSRNVSRLMRLINDILDIHKIEAGKLQLNVLSVDVSKLIREAVAGMLGWAQSKDIVLDIKLEEDLPSVLWDYDKIIQVLTNFMSNAIKYTPEKGLVTIVAKKVRGEKELEACEGHPIPVTYDKAVPVEPQDEYILVSVADTGTGMASEDMEKVFDKFYQIEHATGEKIKGTGLGLPIAREIVQMHHGRIWVSSKLKVGSTFTVALPVRDNSLIFA